MWSWRGKFAASARAWQPALGHGCGKQTPSDSILFFRTNLLYVLNVEMYREVWFRSAHDFGTLNERNPPPRGGVLLTMFPDQELYDEMQRSYLVVESLTHGSWSGNIVNRKPPPGGVSFDQLATGRQGVVPHTARSISFWKLDFYRPGRFECIMCCRFQKKSLSQSLRSPAPGPCSVTTYMRDWLYRDDLSQKRLSHQMNATFYSSAVPHTASHTYILCMWRRMYVTYIHSMYVTYIYIECVYVTRVTCIECMYVTFILFHIHRMYVCDTCSATRSFLGRNILSINLLPRKKHLLQDSQQ